MVMYFLPLPDYAMLKTLKVCFGWIAICLLTLRSNIPNMQCFCSQAFCRMNM